MNPRSVRKNEAANETRSGRDFTRALSRTLTRFRNGDFAVRMPEDWDGTEARVADTLNGVLEMNAHLLAELERLKRQVGKEGKLGQRVSLPAMGGGWNRLGTAVNGLIDDLVRPTHDMARVIGAVAKGDLTQEMDLEPGGRRLEGEFLRIGRTVNTMISQLASFSSEVARVAREVGAEGQLGGQARVRGVAGMWKELTENVNSMARNLTDQVRNIAEVTTAVARGDLSKKITVEARGEVLLLKETINTMVDQLSSFASEVTRVAREVGTEGKLGGQANVSGASGTWKDLTDNVNMMAGNLTDQVRNIADVTTAVANGDLSKKITVQVRGEILELKNTINTMVDQLRAFASEVTRVAREVGTEGKLGGQANISGASGTWKDLTDNVNMLADNLTTQVRNIADVTTAVARGDLSKKITVDVRGEIQELKSTINTMVDQLRAFASEVTRVAREVGVEGKLGGQASVQGVAGTWKDLTDSVNQLAASLTTQLRAIAEVSTAVTEGDLTQSITVAAAGEVSELKNNINQMIERLRETSLINTEQDWLKTNLTNFTRRLQGQRDLLEVGRMVLSDLAPVVNAQHGLFYLVDDGEEEPELKLFASFAHTERKELASRFRLGEGLIGQTALEKKRILVTNIPGQYIQIQSGLGFSAPTNVVVLPVVFEDQLKGVIELASFDLFTDAHLMFLEQLMESLGVVINTIEANMRTETLLKQSQLLAHELQNQQLELQESNTELENKARELARQNEEVERKNREVELAKEEIEEKAEQLSLTSRYKSEFLANMSHELRTPLNSLLILSHQLADNPDGNLSPRQVEYAATIHDAGSDLLSLINDILDLSKIESGTVTLDLEDIPLSQIALFVERNFRHVGEQKNLTFTVQMQPGLPESIHTEPKRLQQILKNLLSNAFKFTHEGSVSLTIAPTFGGFSRRHQVLTYADSVIGFTVSDTGIGIPLDKQKIIFEAFQQAEGSTNRKYGGTGLGLSISREISVLLGGEITLESIPGQGSSFTLYLPSRYLGPSEMKDPVATRSSGGEAVMRNHRSAARVRTGHTPSTRAEYLRQIGVDLVDDRDRLGKDDCSIVIIEDDPAFAKVLLEVAQEQDFRGLVAGRGDNGLAMIHGYHPSAIALDINLPDVDGWTLIERVKSDPETRHIPILVISIEDDRMRCIRYGAFDALTKPVSKINLVHALRHVREFVCEQKRNLLVVRNDPGEQDSITELLSAPEIRMTVVEKPDDAFEVIHGTRFDCVVLEGFPSPSEMTELVGQLRNDNGIGHTPLIVYTNRDMTVEEETGLNRLAGSVLVKDVRSPERLLEVATQLMHVPLSSLPLNRRRMIEDLNDPAHVLTGKKALIVDDDARNIFAMTSLLERNGMIVSSAESGIEALAMLPRMADMDIVLMDIMMPEMDGCEVISRIRGDSRFRNLPIIAVTAKAMKDDREKCLNAGASDYVTKPIEPDQLLNLLRAWLHR